MDPKKLESCFRVLNMVRTRFSSPPSSTTKSDVPPTRKITKKSKAPLKTKRARAAIQDDPVSVDEASPGSTSKAIMPSKQKKNTKSKATVKYKRPKLAIHDNHIPVNEGMDYIIPFKDHKPAKLSTNNRYELITAIWDTLSSEQVALFAAGCFGNFTRLPSFKIQHQLIHNLLLRQIIQPNSHEICIGVAGVKMSFGIKEFALVTGLRCFGSVDKTRYARTDNSFMATYFSDIARVYRSSVKKVFDTQGWKTDEDAVKFAKLYLLQNFLLSSTHDCPVPKGDLDIIDSGDFDKFPWGKEVFTCTLESLKHAARTTSKDNYYRLVGFPYAFQLWFYECCPYLNGRYCNVKAAGCIPRMLKWSSEYACKFGETYQMLSLTALELQLRNITPTEKEIEELQLEDIVDRDADIVRHPPPSFMGASTSSDRPQSRMSHLEMENKVTLLTSEVDGLKKTISEMRSHFDLEFSKLRAIVDKQNENTLDPLSHLNQAATNVGDWGSWPQSNQNVVYNDVEVANEDENIDDEGGNFEDAFDNVSDDNEVGNDVFNEVENQVEEGRQEVVEDGTNVTKVAFEDSEDASMSENGSIDLDRTVKMAAMINDDHDDDDHVATDIAKVSVEDTNIALGVPTVAELQTDASFLDEVSPRELYELSQAAMRATEAKYQKMGASAKPVDSLGIPPESDSVVPILDKATPAMPKRSVKLPSYLRSPFLQDFGSSSIKGNEVLKNLKGVSALDDNIGQLPSLEAMKCFTTWLDTGMITKKKVTSFYSRKNNVISPPLDLGVHSISQKMWFHTLEYGSTNLTNSHVDVFFYHLGKKVKSNSTSPLKISSVDFTFQSRLAAQFETYDPKATKYVLDQDIVGIVKGEIIGCNTPWALSDDILFPIWLAEQEHWILGRLNFIDREFHVYNTLQCDGVRDILAKAANPFIQLLPAYLKATGFYDRKDINFSSYAYSKKAALDCFDLTLHHVEFNSSPNDSGIYMLSYAEYYATMPNFPQSGELELGAHRSRLALLFYSYGMSKQIYGYESDSENIAKAPTTKAPSPKAPTRKAQTTKAPTSKAPTTKPNERKRKARDVKK